MPKIKADCRGHIQSSSQLNCERFFDISNKSYKNRSLFNFRFKVLTKELKKNPYNYERALID